MMTLLPSPGPGAAALLERLSFDPLLLEPGEAWTETGRQRWGMVLTLAFPPLPAVNARFEIKLQPWRGAWGTLAGTPVLWAQERAPRDQLRPWVVVPLEAPVDALLFWGAWLDHLGASFSRLTVREARKACPDADLAGRLSGPAWALLSGRGAGKDMIQLEDVLVPGGKP